MFAIVWSPCSLKKNAARSDAIASLFKYPFSAAACIALLYISEAELILPFRRFSSASIKNNLWIKCG